MGCRRPCEKERNPLEAGHMVTTVAGTGGGNIRQHSPTVELYVHQYVDAGCKHEWLVGQLGLEDITRGKTARLSS